MLYGRKLKIFSAFLLVVLFVAFSSSVSFAAPNDSVTEIDILINSHSFKNLINASNKGKDYPALVKINKSKHINLTVNTRGSSSFVDGVFSETKRIPFELSFDTYTRTWAYSKMSSLKLNNSFNLYRMTAEYLALNIYRSIGVPVSDAFPVFLSFNGIDFGLYLGVEDVDEIFLLKHYGEDALDIGNLYKSVDPDSMHETDPTRCISTTLFGTLYNKCGNGNHDHLFAFLDLLDNGGDFEQYLDMDEALRFFACTAATGGNDTLLSTSHNFYLYEHNGKFSLIPWDLSSAFDCFGDRQSINPDHVNNTTNEFFNMIMENDENRQKYYGYIEEIRSTLLTPEIVDPFILDFVDTVKDYCVRDRSSPYNPYFSLEHISSGDALVNGNIILAVNEIYRQLEEQMSGTCDFFYTPDSIKSNIFDLYDEIEVFSFNTSEIIDDVCKNYFIAHLKHTFDLPQVQTITVFSVFCVSLVSLYLLHRIPKGKKKQLKLFK